MSRFMEKMLVDMALRGFSPHTKEAYLLHVKKFGEHFGKPLRIYVKHKSENTCITGLLFENSVTLTPIVCLAALKFFFANTLGRKWNDKVVPRAKRGRKLPNTLSKDEILSLFNATHNLKHRAVLMTAYSAGLRVSEVAHLRITDIDSKNMQIFINQGKGQVDRYSIFSMATLGVLREYYKQYRPKHWLFPGQDPTKPITTSALTLVFHYAKQKVDIKKKVSIHSLRHSFATHLIEEGVDLCHIQKLLGHKSMSTTGKYLHLTRLNLANVKSPLDTIPAPTDD